MRVEVPMPQLGETVSEGTVTRWLFHEGDSVTAGEPMLEITTDKVSMEVPCLQSGVLSAVLVHEGDTVPVGTAIAWLEVEGEAASDTRDEPLLRASSAGSLSTPSRDDAVDAVRTSPAMPSSDASPRPSPLIRRLLEEAGITADQVAGSGPGGRILREDVAAAAAELRTLSAPREPVRSTSGDRTEPLSHVRTVIAERMVTSLRTSAQLTTVVEADVTRVDEAIARSRETGESGRGRLSYTTFFARAAIEGLAAHPMVNASIDTSAGTLTYHDAIHLAVAVETEAGLLAPVIRNADRLSLLGLSEAITDVAIRARAGTIGVDELSGGTFTLTNTGSRGALFDTPIINQPQVAILATGAVTRRPIVVTDPVTMAEGVAVRSMVYVALTYDHRLIDGAAGASFLVTVKDWLEGGSFDGSSAATHRPGG